MMNQFISIQSVSLLVLSEILNIIQLELSLVLNFEDPIVSSDFLGVLFLVFPDK